MPKVNPNILKWARETAGLTLEEATAKIGLKATKDIQAIDRLSALESGETEPTRAQLVKMAKQYRRPLLSFYLSAPPRAGKRGQDFRTLPIDYDKTRDALLNALIRDVQARQSLVRAVLEDEDEAVELDFIGSTRVGEGAEVLHAAVQSAIDFDIDEYRSQASNREAFSWLRSIAEEAGIFVLLKGDLGSHHTAIDVDVFRGFVLADPVAPFIVINDHDSRAAWSFTLLHELAHLCLGQTGISGVTSDDSVERLCNTVAGELLLPSAELRRFANGKVLDGATITTFAKARNLSSTMVAYNLYRIDVLSRNEWLILREEFKERWLEARAKKRRLNKEGDGGPSFYLIRGHRVGRGLLDLVSRMLGAGALTSSKAGKVLGVKGVQVQQMLDTHGYGGVRRPA
jgi:Zn-dependent peptidase ImmA (M78 family)